MGSPARKRLPTLAGTSKREDAHLNTPGWENAMAWKCQAKAKRSEPAERYGFANVTWRSDDPWGCLWRALFEALWPLMQYPPEPVEKHHFTLTMEVSFKPDKEDFETSLFPKDPLDQHRGKRMKQKGKEIPRE